MLTANKQLLLTGFLGQLPENVAMSLARAIEVDRLVGGSDIPHEQILSALRPQLRHAAQRQRTGTPLRHFCRPFEDLLVNARKVKQKGRIARSSIGPVWRWLQIELMGERHTKLTNGIRNAILQGRDLEVDGKLAVLWREAAEAMRAALADRDRTAAAGRVLGGQTVAEDAAEMALLVGGAERVLVIQKRLPKPIAVLANTEVDFLRDTFEDLCESDPDLAPYVGLIVMGRLERPWEALRLTAVMSGKMTDTIIASTDVGAVGELLFADLDIYTKKIQAARPIDFEPKELLANLAAFTELSSGMVKELGIRRDGKWGHRLAKDRAAVSDIMEGLVERAHKEILAALPALKASGRKQRPLEIGWAPDQDRVARALRYTYLLVHARPFAEAAAFSAKLADVMDATSTALRAYNEDILNEVRTAPPDLRASVDRHFNTAVDICKLIFGNEEANYLKRRSKLAPATA